MTHLCGLRFLCGLVVALSATTAHAQLLSLTATSANVSKPGTPVTIRILRWSTDEERNPLVAALNPTPPATSAPPTAGGGAAGREGRGGAGRAGRGGARGRGRGDAAPAALTPIAALTAAIEKAPTIGYIWTTDVTGYSIKYAYRTALPDGGERIILLTDRRLGAHTPAWKPAAAAQLTDYEFTLVEMRLNTKGLGEGRTSLTTRVIVDSEAKTVALDDYAAAPAILQNVKRSS